MAAGNEYTAEQELAENPATPAHQLHKLSETKDEYVKNAIASHPNTQSHTLESLHAHAAQDPKAHKELMDSILMHKNTPSHIIDQHVAGIDPEQYRENHDEVLNHPKADVHAVAAKMHAAIGHHLKDAADPEWGTPAHHVLHDAKQWLKNPRTGANHIKPYASHPNKDIAEAAVASGKLPPDAVKKFINRKDVNASDLREMVSNDSEHKLPSDVLSAMHKKKFKDEDEHGYYERQMHEEILEHPNVPDDVHAEALSQKPEKDSLKYSYDNNRIKALKHKKASASMVEGLVRKKDPDAMRAAVERPDTSADTLRFIHKNIASDGKADPSQAERALVAHPNLPEDIQMEYAQGETNHARLLHRRADLSEPVLKELVGHKNKNVAVDSLAHKSVTKGIVEHAFNRKSADVSRAAANHELASPEMVDSKISSDPWVAHENLPGMTDPDQIKSVYQKFGKGDVKQGDRTVKGDKADEVKRAIHHQLAKNPNTPASVMKELALRMGSTDEGADWNHKQNMTNAITKHPNLDAEGRKMAFGTRPLEMMSHPNLTPEEMESTLQEHKQRAETQNAHETDDNKKYYLPNRMAGEALKHPNLTPELAKKILTGGYGTRPGADSSGYSGKQADIDLDHPAFTPEVIHAGMNAPSEFTNPDIVHELAQSKHLDAAEINRHWNEESRSSDAHDTKYFEQKHLGLLKNPNINHDTLTKVLAGSTEHNYINKSPENYRSAALQNPSLSDHSLKQFAEHGDSLAASSDQDADDANRRVHGRVGALSEHISSVVAGRLKERGLEDHGLKHAAAPVVNKLLDNAHGEERLEMFGKALDHKNPDVVRDVLDNHAVNASAHIEEGDDATRAKLFDRFQGGEDKEVEKLALPHMTEAARGRFMDSADLNDPETIKALPSEDVSKMKITKDMPAAAARNVLEHKGATPEHREQAIEHSAGMAQDVIERASRDEVGRGGRRQKTKLPVKDIEALHDKIMGTYKNFKNPKDQAEISLHGYMAANARKPEHLKALTSNENAMTVASHLADNDKISTSNLDKLTKYKGEAFSDSFGQLAGHKKAGQKLLTHIAENYPEHHDQMARNGNAVQYTPVLKKLVEKGDAAVHASLVNNAYTPKDVKTHLLENPEVAILAGGTYDADPEVLDKHAAAHSPALDEKILTNHSVQDKTIRKIIKHHMGDGGSKKVLQVAARHASKLEPEEQALLVKHSPEVAAKVLENVNNYGTEAAIKALDIHKGNDHVLRAAMENEDLHRPSVISKVIDNFDFDKQMDSPDDGRRNASIPVSPAETMKDYLENSDHVNDSHWESAYSKFKAARPNGYRYGKNGPIAESDADFLRSMAENAPASVQDDMIKDKGFHNALSKNPNISPQHYNTILDSIASKPLSGDDGSFNTAWNLADNPRSNAASLDKIYNAIKSTNTSYNIIPHLAKNKKLSPKTAQDLWEKFQPKEMLSNPAMPKEAFVKHLNESMTKSDAMDDITKAVMNPNFRLKDIDQNVDTTKLSDGENNMFPHSHFRVMGLIPKNFNAAPEDLETAYNSRYRDAYGKDVADFVKHPRTPEHVIKDMYERKKISFEDALHSPGYGGKLFREREHVIPDLPNLDSGKAPLGNEASYKSKAAQDKIHAISSQIPAGGKIAWADYKKANPAADGDPVVKKLFTSAPKQEVDVKHAEKYLNESIPTKKVHISYAKWDGMQRHNGEPQLVVQANQTQDMNDAMKSDPSMNGVYRLVQDGANRALGSHPVTPQTIGWSRVDTSNKDHWFIDEIQSDFNSGLQSELHRFQKKGGGDKMESYGIDKDNIPKSLSKLQEHTAGWDKATLQHVIDLAKAHGAKKVSIHSGKTKTMSNKGDDAEITHKYDKIYNKLPQEFGFGEDYYQNVPSHNPKSKLVGNKIWTLNLGDNTAAPKSKKTKVE